MSKSQRAGEIKQNRQRTQKPIRPQSIGARWSSRSHDQKNPAVNKYMYENELAKQKSSVYVQGQIIDAFQSSVRRVEESNCKREIVLHFSFYITIRNP